MMTEEFKAMCQAITEMAKNELSGKDNGCFILYAHEGSEQIKGACGKGIDLATGIAMCALACIEQLPDRRARVAMATAVCAVIMRNALEPEEETKDA